MLATNRRQHLALQLPSIRECCMTRGLVSGWCFTGHIWNGRRNSKRRWATLMHSSNSITASFISGTDSWLGFFLFGSEFKCCFIAADDWHKVEHHICCGKSGLKDKSITHMMNMYTYKGFCLSSLNSTNPRLNQPHSLRCFRKFWMQAKTIHFCTIIDQLAVSKQHIRFGFPQIQSTTYNVTHIIWATNRIHCEYFNHHWRLSSTPHSHRSSTKAAYVTSRTSWSSNRLHHRRPLLCSYQIKYISGNQSLSMLGSCNAAQFNAGLMSSCVFDMQLRSIVRKCVRFVCYVRKYFQAYVIIWENNIEVEWSSVLNLYFLSSRPQYV